MSGGGWVKRTQTDTMGGNHDRVDVVIGVCRRQLGGSVNWKRTWENIYTVLLMGWAEEGKQCQRQRHLSMVIPYKFSDAAISMQQGTRRFSHEKG